MRKIIGYALLALSALAWGAVLALPLFGVSWTEAVLAATVLIVIGEAGFLLAAALLGKDILAGIKAHLRG